MRNLLTIVLILFLIFGFAKAENVFDTMTDAELIKMYENMEVELANRGIAKSAFITKGKYNIEGMIPIGLYKVSMINGTMPSFAIQTHKKNAEGELERSNWFEYSVDKADYALVQIVEGDCQVTTFADSVWIKVESLF